MVRRRRQPPRVFFPWERRGGVLGALGTSRLRLAVGAVVFVALALGLRSREEHAASVRAALYWPAIVAMRRCEGFKAFAERLAARGKAKGVIIGAVMRKLLHVVYGVLKHKTPFDPNKVLGPTRSST